MEQSRIGLTINDVGIAEALSRWQLAVPTNQRAYAWTDDYVDALFDDLTKAFDHNRPIYFLGTIVLTDAPTGVREIADGQQRLATISILIAAIRDYLLELGDDQAANAYQSELLIKYDPPTRDYRAKLRLNEQDDQFFFDYILSAPSEKKPTSQGVYASNERLKSAAEKARQHVRNITAALKPDQKPQRLYEWIEYLRTSAVVIAIIVPPTVSSSFRMFETLNARGVSASQVDILRNYLYDNAPVQRSKMHSHWIATQSRIESYGSDELLLKYIRTFVTCGFPCTDLPQRTS